MRRIAFATTVLICCMVSTEAYAQNGGLLGRLFRPRQATTQYYTPTYQQNLQYTPVYQQNFQRPVQSGYRYPTYSRTPTPVTGYGSNLHRNYMIRRAQQRTATTGVQPRNTGNIYWGR